MLVLSESLQWASYFKIKDLLLNDEKLADDVIQIQIHVDLASFVSN